MPVAPPPAPAQDLLGDDFFGGGDSQPQPAKGGGGFDGFGADPFDDFNPRGSTSAAAQAHAPDPFFARKTDLRRIVALTERQFLYAQSSHK